MADKIDRKRKSIAVLIFLSLVVPSFLAIPSAALAAQDAGPYVIGETAVIKSKILGEDRRIFIYTHSAYGEDESRYPVAYVLDGEWNFLHTSGVIDLMSSRELIPWMIVVGIPNIGRIKDLSPSPIKDQPRGGGAKAFRAFLRDEVFPFVEASYRTEPFRLLIGHSLSGLFAVDTLLSDPTLFNAYIAVSPYLIWDENRFLDQIPETPAGRIASRTFLSASLGAEPRLEAAFERFERILAERNSPGLDRYFRRFPDCDHETVYFQAVVRGLLDIFPDWRLPPEAAAAGLGSIRKHYDGLTAKYGFEIRPVYFVIHMIGSDAMERGEIDEAIRILLYAVGLNPELPHAYGSLGRCFRAKGMRDEAIRNYEKALRLAPADAEARRALEEMKKKGT